MKNKFTSKTPIRRSLKPDELKSSFWTSFMIPYRFSCKKITKKLAILKDYCLSRVLFYLDFAKTSAGRIPPGFSPPGKLSSHSGLNLCTWFFPREEALSFIRVIGNYLIRITPLSWASSLNNVKIPTRITRSWSTSYHVIFRPEREKNYHDNLSSPSQWYHQSRSAAPAGEDIKRYPWIMNYYDIFIKIKVIFYVSTK